MVCFWCIYLGDEREGVNDLFLVCFGRVVGFVGSSNAFKGVLLGFSRLFERLELELPSQSSKKLASAFEAQTAFSAVQLWREHI